MNTLVADLKKRFEGCVPRINHITVVDKRCIRIEYSTDFKLQWLEIWAFEDSPVFTLLCHEKILSPKKVNKTELLELLKSKFTVPEQV